MTTLTASKWIRVNRRNECPVCGKPDWCLISQDGKAAICARIESDKPVGSKGAGWLHKVDAIKPLPSPKPRPAAKQTPKAATDVLSSVSEVSVRRVVRSRYEDVREKISIEEVG